jgi:Sec1 family
VFDLICATLSETRIVYQLTKHDSAVWVCTLRLGVDISARAGSDALVGCWLQHLPLVSLHLLAIHVSILPCVSRLWEEQAEAPVQQRAPSRGIDTLILLDRAVDVITPCCTQLTYEGLIDEVFGIVNGAMQLESSGWHALYSYRISTAPPRCIYHQNVLSRQLNWITSCNRGWIVFNSKATQQVQIQANSVT